MIDGRLNDCDCVYVTPSHQSPTTVTMPMERRRALLEAASREEILVIEDDYDAETNFVSSPTPALKSMDRNQQVLYVGSFSKYLAPGIRIGYLVAPEELIHQARQLRLLIMRHPPANNQRTLALFIAGGYYESLVHRLQRGYKDRWEAMGTALEKFLPDITSASSFGGDQLLGARAGRPGQRCLGAASVAAGGSSSSRDRSTSCPPGRREIFSGWVFRPSMWRR